MSVLGAMLLGDRAAIEKATGVLRREDFYREAHARVFDAMAGLSTQGEPVDIVTLKDALNRKGILEQVGGVAYLMQLADFVPTAANVAYYANIVREKSILRRLIEASTEIAALAYSEAPVERLLSEFERAAEEARARAAGEEELPPLVRLSEVTPECVTWLWRGRVPFGKITILDGDPGLGKSTLSLDLAARLSNGQPMPGEIGAPDPGNTLLLTVEDGLGDTVRPRLEAAGADLNRVLAFPGVPETNGRAGHGGSETRPPQLPTDVALLREYIMRSAVRLVIIDPLMAFLPQEVNAFRDQDVRRALAPVARMAEETGAAVLILRHLNKGGGGGSALYRGGGSIGISGAARSVLLVSKHPDDDERRVLAPVKNNLARMPPALTFALASDAPEQPGRIVWEGESDISADALLASQVAESDRSTLDEACEFLVDRLANGRVKAGDVHSSAREAGISPRTLERAKKRLGVRSRKEGGVGDDGHWAWELPGAAEQPSAEPASPKIANNTRRPPTPKLGDLRGGLAAFDELDPAIAAIQSASADPGSAEREEDVV